MRRDSLDESRFSDHASDEAVDFRSDVPAPVLPLEGNESSQRDLGAPVEPDEIDGVGADPIRLAGASAALGSCFGVMIAALVLGSAAAVSGPRALQAQEAPPARSTDSTAIPGVIEASAPLSAMAAESAAMPPEDAAALAALERDVFAARARVESARARLSLSRSAMHSDLVSRADASRRRAAAEAEHAAANPSLVAAALERGSQRRALEQLARDRAAIEALEKQAAEDLARLEAEVERAQAALARWREGRSPDALADKETPDPLAGDLSAARSPAGRPGAEGAIDLFPLIARHRARLMSAAAESPADAAASP